MTGTCSGTARVPGTSRFIVVSHSGPSIWFATKAHRHQMHLELIHQEVAWLRIMADFPWFPDFPNPKRKHRLIDPRLCLTTIRNHLWGISKLLIVKFLLDPGIMYSFENNKRSKLLS